MSASLHPEPPELPANELGRRFRYGVRRGSGQDAGAFGDVAGGSGAWPQLARYAGRWLKPDGQRPVLELLRPAAVLRSQDAAGRDAVLRPREACARTRRELGGRRRRHVLHLQAAQGCAMFHDGTPGHGKGREVVVRPGRQGRRLPDLPDVGRLAGKTRTVRRRSTITPSASTTSARTRCCCSMSAVVGPVHHQFGTRKEERDTRAGPLGDGLAEEQRGRRRRLPDRKLEARQRNDLSPASTTGRAARCRS